MLRNHKPSAHFVAPLAERSGPARRPAFNLRVFLRSGQHHRQVRPAPGADGVQTGGILPKDLAQQEEQRAERLVLSGRSHPALQGKFAEEGTGAIRRVPWQLALLDEGAVLRKPT